MEVSCITTNEEFKGHVRMFTETVKSLPLLRLQKLHIICVGYSKACQMTELT